MVSQVMSSLFLNFLVGEPLITRFPSWTESRRERSIIWEVMEAPCGGGLNGRAYFTREFLILRSTGQDCTRSLDMIYRGSNGVNEGTV